MHATPLPESHSPFPTGAMEPPDNLIHKATWSFKGQYQHLELSPEGNWKPGQILQDPDLMTQVRTKGLQLELPSPAWQILGVWRMVPGEVEFGEGMSSVGM